MATDFFERQDRARGKTTLLVLYFILALVGIIAALYFVIVLIWSVVLARKEQAGAAIDWWNPQFLLWIGLGTVVVVGLSSLFKSLSLRGGGGAVARSVGGKKVEPFTQNPGQRRLLNVVEEMAIASGVPVPEVYVLPEAGINAFAAGYSPDDAAVAVTQGCIDTLSRDELQGVIAHEFSHILNGDMRLNIRLMGIVFGILVLTVIGGVILRSVGRVRMTSSRSSGNGKGGGGAAVIVAIFLTAIALYIIGYIGVFFGRLIQSAVSRQREFLADASAVQFTRNPGGIAGALKRIGGSMAGSRVENAHAQETAHFFFASGLKSGFGGIFATHPPLEERIRAIEPGWDGKFTVTSPPKPEPEPDARPRKAAKAPPPLLNPMEMVVTVGTLSAAALDQAQSTRASLDEAFGPLLRSPLEARALLYALVLDPEETRRSQQIGYLQTEAGEEVAQATRELYPRLTRLKRSEYLPLIELTLPALSQMEADLCQEFQKRLRYLVEMDGKVTVLEFVITRLVRKHLERRQAKKAHPGSYIWSASALGEPLSEVLSALIHLDTPEAGVAKSRFEAAAEVWPPFKPHLRFIQRERLNFAGLDQALDQLGRGAYGLRKQVLRVCATAIRDDGKVTPDEAELFRAIAVSLDCPMPPLAT